MNTMHYRSATRYARTSHRPGLTLRQKRGSFKTFKIKGRPIDSEIGQFLAYLDSSAFRGMRPKEHLQSHNYQKLYLDLIQNLSYRHTTESINKFLHLSDNEALKSTTLENRVESFGDALSSAYESETERILESHHIDVASGIIDEDSTISSAAITPDLPAVHDEGYIRSFIADYNRGRDCLTKLKFSEQTKKVETSSDRCCYITVDDVGVKFQKSQRKGKSKKSKKYVENTVIHVQADGGQYTITAIGMDNAFRRLIAFLLETRLMENHRLIFLTDGAVNIRDRIDRFFAFREYSVILDWLHLDKKCYEYMSMAVKGTKAEKDGMKKTLSSILWTGRADKAIKFLNDIKKKNIKNDRKLNELKDYILRKTPMLTCYALRHELGLKISSNRVEKENDLVVASRQKHNGMSWSDKGSGAIAIITAASRNNELDSFLVSKQIRFKLCA